MSRAALAIQQLSVSGNIAALTFTAPNGAGAGNGNTVATNGAPNVALIVNNLSGGGTRTVTIVNGNSGVNKGVTLPSQTKSVTQAKVGVIQLGPDTVQDASGNICVDIDSVDSGNVTWAAVQMAGIFQ